MIIYVCYRRRRELTPEKEKKKKLKQKLKEAPEPQYYILLRFGAFRPLRDRDLRRDAVIIRPFF